MVSVQVKLFRVNLYTVKRTGIILMVQDQIELHVAHRLKDFNPVCYLVKFVTNATQHVHFRNSNGAL